MLMQSKTAFRVGILVLGDVLMLYASLFLTLVVRYGGDFYAQLRDFHFVPFTIIFALWILVFYISGLYDIRHLRNTLEFVKNLNLTITVSAALTVLLFYFIHAFVITPKTNLFIFLVIFFILEILWRRKFSSLTSSIEPPNKLIVVDGDKTKAINTIISSDANWLTQLGYKISAEVREEDVSSNPKMLNKLVSEKGANLIVIPRRLKNNPELVRTLYQLMNKGVEVRDLPNFYELVVRKIPIDDLEESWFLENLAVQQKFYDPLKRALEFITALVLFVIFFPINIVIALIIKFTSKGAVIYKQVRVGKNGRKFTLYKFRTMTSDAEPNGAQWAAPGDKRVTTLGKFLRHTHLDELPQLWNILLGNLSFVGPRPERQEFVKKLKEEIPYYEVRLLIKPGVTGWAQIRHRADISEEDVIEKLQYDIYYIKNRSPVLDLTIILKTIKTLFVTPK